MSTEIRGRRALLAALRTTGRDHSDATVLWHSAVASRVGIHTTDYKVMSLLQRSGPLSAGAIVEATGLASGSVTALVDRLTGMGFARRVRDASDGRRVLVEITSQGIAAFEPYFRSPELAHDRLYAPYDEDQLAVILDFLTRSTQRLRRAIEGLEDR
jgi:DNA-binding MarR family transcriptional regulator